MKKHNISNIAERGKTMIEMIAVLAISGLLLSIGITGYKELLSTHHAEEIIYDIKRVVTQVVTDSYFLSLDKTHTIHMDSLVLKTPYSLRKESSYNIKVQNLSSEICNKLKYMDIPWIEELIFNNGWGCKSDDHNFINVYFNRDLNKNITDPNRYSICENNEDCGECGICSKDKICVDINTKCNSENPICANGICGKCLKDFFLNIKNECQKCPDDNTPFYVENSSQGMAECHKCGSDRFISGEGVCYSCYDENSILPSFSGEMGKKECGRCPNRFWPHYSCNLCNIKEDVFWVNKEDCQVCAQRYWTPSYNKCHYCQGKVNAEGTLCHWDCPQGQFGALSQCHQCDDKEENISGSNIETCRKCGGLRFPDIHGGCLRCDIKEDVFWVNKEDCLSCKNRYWNPSNMNCRFCAGVVTDAGEKCIPK